MYTPSLHRKTFFATYTLSWLAKATPPYEHPMDNDATKPSIANIMYFMVLSNLRVLAVLAILKPLVGVLADIHMPENAE